MTISLDAQYFAVADDSFLGHCGETNSRSITFIGLDNVPADMYSIIFSYSDGVTYETRIVDETVTLTNGILRKAGKVEVQIYACNMDDDEYILVKKSNILELEIKPSLDENTKPVPAIADSLRIIAQIEQCAASLANMGEALVLVEENIQDEQQGILHQISELGSRISVNSSSIGTSCKNLLRIGASDKTVNGVSFTVNDDGSFTLDGENDEHYTSFLLTSDTDIEDIKHIPNGNYILCSNEISNANIYVIGYKYDGESVLRCSIAGTDGTQEVSFTVDDEYDYNFVLIMLDANSSFDNVRVCPMIRKSDVTDADWEPYRPSLQQQINGLSGGYNEVQGDSYTESVREETTS